jgi:hypothetical protein
MYVRSLQCSVLLVLAAMVGCGDGEPAGRPARVPAGGVVRHNGQPLPGATVVLIPVSDTHGATAMTDNEGRFQLQTFDPGDGAVPGKYQVTVRKVEMVAGRPMANSEGGNGGEGGDEASVIQSIERPLIPEKYFRPTTSGLEAEVSEQGENAFAFDL